MTAPFHLRCVVTGATYPADEVRYRSDDGHVLDVVHRFDRAAFSFDAFDARLCSRDPIDRSGVWRFRELVLPIDPAHMTPRGEGNTGLYDTPVPAHYAGLDRFVLKHEGENPTGSFKDRGMTTGVSMARRLGMTAVACASTGNTSASMASYAALAGLRAIVFIPDGEIAFGKLSQSIAYGARTIQIRGNFDDAMRLVEEVCAREGVYLLNSLNPFRLEGQKAIGLELLQDLRWRVPDWLVLPGGNLGNNSAIHKGLSELRELGLIDRLPRVAIIQAEGASPLYDLFVAGGELVPQPEPETIASAIRIGNPVSWRKTMRVLADTDGVVEKVTDQEIMDAKAVIDAAGIGAEPASCATLAGARKLVGAGIIRPDADVTGILTGHILKDPDATAKYHLAELPGIEPTRANAPIKCDADIDSILRAIAN